MKERSPITTHVLDVHHGKPAAGVAVTLEKQNNSLWDSIAKGKTNADGRVEDLLPAGTPAQAGVYRLTFGTGAYFSSQSTKAFFPIVEIVFEITAPKEHHHVPLLLNANGYTTYRGS